MNYEFEWYFIRQYKLKKKKNPWVVNKTIVQSSFVLTKYDLATKKNKQFSIAPVRTFKRDFQDAIRSLVKKKYS